jgi:hypothetical protein
MVKAGPYAGFDYNLTLPYAHSRVDSKTFTMGNPMSESTLNPIARVDLHPMPESTLSPCQRLWIGPQERNCAHSKPDPDPGMQTNV